MDSSKTFVRKSFGIRKTHVVLKSGILLKYQSHGADSPKAFLRIALNHILVTKIPLMADGKSHIVKIPLNPRTFLRDNQLTFRLVFPDFTSCLTPPPYRTVYRFFPESALSLFYGELPLREEVSFLPEPFVDNHTNVPIKLPVVFFHPPSLETLKAVSALLSWFGEQAKYTDVSFPVVIGRLPASQAILFLTDKDHVPGMLSTAPGVTLVSNPLSHPDRLLILKAGDGAGLLSQVFSLIHTIDGSSPGNRTEKLSSGLPPDWPPSWLPPNKSEPVRNFENDSRLVSDGFPPLPLHVGFELPPALFTWHNPGIRFHFRLRYDLPYQGITLFLKIFANGTFLESVPLPPGEEGQIRNLFLDRSILIPYRYLGKQNQVTFAVTSPTVINQKCIHHSFGALHYTIDPDSKIRLENATTLSEEPQLSEFIHWGYPYTLRANLSRTTIFLENRSDPFLLETALDTVNLWGRFTGRTAGRISFAAPDQPDGDARPDLLVIGYLDDMPLLKRYLPPDLPLKMTASGPLPVMNPGTRISLFLHRSDFSPWFLKTSEKTPSSRPSGWLLQFAATDPEKRIVTLLLFSHSASLSPSVLARLDSMREDNQDKGNWTSLSRTPDGIFVQTRRTQPGHFDGDTPFPLFWQWFFSDRPLYLIALLATTALLSTWIFRLRLRSLIRRRLRWHS
ncbi:MAG: cellulose biosynthesis cyclic di-GMP-binding regulatory protein BcsB [Leptospirales bacterium]